VITPVDEFTVQMLDGVLPEENVGVPGESVSCPEFLATLALGENETSPITPFVGIVP
jgi:hypothetical protein